MTPDQWTGGVRSSLLNSTTDNKQDLAMLVDGFMALKAKQQEAGRLAAIRRSVKLRAAIREVAGAIPPSYPDAVNVIRERFEKHQLRHEVGIPHADTIADEWRAWNAERLTVASSPSAVTQTLLTAAASVHSTTHSTT